MNAPYAIPTQQQIENRLSRWRKHIERALRDADLMTYDDIVKGVADHHYLYFDNRSAFAVVDIQDYTKGRVCHVLAAGGSLEGLRALQEKALPFFRQIGARRLTQAGRLGFMKKLPAWGWRQPITLMQLEL